MMNVWNEKCPNLNFSIKISQLLVIEYILAVLKHITPLLFGGCNEMHLLNYKKLQNFIAKNNVPYLGLD